MLSLPILVHRRRRADERWLDALDRRCRAGRIGRQREGASADDDVHRHDLRGHRRGGWLALAHAIPEAVERRLGALVWRNLDGPNPRTRRPFADIHFMGKGGGGATYGYDGWDHIGSVVCLGGVRAPDPELHELASPYTVLCYEYLPDSAGAGRWRGGLGVSHAWRVEADEVRMAFCGGGALPETMPIGILGGGSSQTNRITVHHVDGDVTEVTPNSMMTLRRGDVVETLSAGGGGCGDPCHRPPERVQRDVVDGVVSVEAASEKYGVALDPETLEIDQEKTKALRERRAS